MDEKQKELFEIFKMAVEDERRAQEMYRKAIDLCDDEHTKEILEKFYQDEVLHEKAIIERYNKMKKTVK
jgi:rubrerythrin